MDTNITGFSPAPPRLDAAGHPRAALPGEAPEPRGDEAHTADPGAVLSGPVASVPTKPRRHTALLAGAGMLGVAVAGGAFLFSPYNTFVPVDTGRLGSQARQLAAGQPFDTCVFQHTQHRLGHRSYARGIEAVTREHQVGRRMCGSGLEPAGRRPFGRG